MPKTIFKLLATIKTSLQIKQLSAEQAKPVPNTDALFACLCSAHGKNFRTTTQQPEAPILKQSEELRTQPMWNSEPVNE